MHIAMTIADLFRDSFERHPDRPALVVGDRLLSYHELGVKAMAIARCLACLPASQVKSNIGLFAHPSISTYVGVLGILMAGKTYVPLNPKFPAQRIAAAIRSADLKVIVTEPTHAVRLNQVFEELEWVPVLVEMNASGDLTSPLPLLGTEATFTWPVRGAENLAYLLFTSGSTGTPKGVGITHANVLSYLRSVAARYEPTPEDRFSQTFDLTFDLSMHDMFLCWSAGACLCVLPDNATLAPARFIRDHALTFWFSVPSTGIIMRRFRALKPNAFPSLRWSLFCGEGLPAKVAADWAVAAPDSTVENLYGPTEATIAFTTYRWIPGQSELEVENGLVPIGRPLPGQYCLVVDAALRPLLAGEPGELLLSGDQLAPGYYKNPEETAARFITLDVDPEQPRCWYRTGDLVRFDPEAGYKFLGRMDNQIKVLGYRVELAEIEHALREVSGTDEAVVIPWPLYDTGAASGLIAFLASAKVDPVTIRAGCVARLPIYMVPQEIRFLETMPLNANGKVDRSALRDTLETGRVSGAKSRANPSCAPADSSRNPQNPNGSDLTLGSRVRPSQ